MTAAKLLRLITIASMMALFLASPHPAQAQDTAGSISGIVVDADLNALGSIPVTVGSFNGDYLDATCSDAQGHYAFTGLPFDSYVVEAAGNGFDCGSEFSYARTYWPSAPFANTAETIVIDSIQPERSDIDFWLPRGGTISGAAADINGTPLPSGRVSIALYLDDYSFPTELYTCTDYGGTYAIKHIPLNINYKVAAGVFPCPDNLGGYGPVAAWPDSPVNSGGDVVNPTTSNPDIYNIDFFLRPLGATPTGNDVLTLTSTGFITFDSVDVSGTTTVQPIVSDPTPVPPNFQVVDYYELSTTATFNSAQVCFRYDESKLNGTPESDVRLLHKENFVWVNVTDPGYPNTTDNVVCGTVSSFSPFVVAQQASYNFSGFFQPVDNLPTVNLVRAGSTIPVKFSLGGNQGLDIFEAGYPKSQAVACDTTAPVDGIEETITASLNGLSYDASQDQYIYAWKTDKSWANTCRQFVIKLDDGTFHRANFKFK